MNKDTNSIVVLAILLSLAIGIFAIRPLLTSYRGDLASAAASKEEETQLIDAKASLVKLQQEFSVRSNEVTSLLSAIPSDVQIPELVSQINSLASASLVSLLTIQPNLVEGSSDTSITLTVSGGYSNIIALAENLEKNLRPAQIQTLNIIKTDANSDQLMVTIGILFAQGSVVEGGR